MRDRQYPLYHEELEHESCGVGAIVDLSGKSTHRTVDQALSIVERLAHRAGSDALGTTGDGVGIMTNLPHALFSAWAQEEGISLGNPGDYGVGMFFLPEDEVGAENIRCIFEQLASSEGLTVLGWRNVPCHPAQLGAGARRTMPARDRGKPFMDRNSRALSSIWLSLPPSVTTGSTRRISSPMTVERMVSSRAFIRS